MGQDMYSFNPWRKRLVIICFAAFVAACSDSSIGASADTAKASADTTPVAPQLTVYKRKTCGCCNKWIDHIQNQGFHTVAHNYAELSAFKLEKGVPANYHSCHTALSKEGYVFEGHIPAKFIHRFLAEKPKDAIGLTVPGMPVGSPGMMMGTRFTPYSVFLLKADGSVETYARINSKKEQFE
jgi:hypothetical protein